MRAGVDSEQAQAVTPRTSVTPPRLAAVPRETVVAGMLGDPATFFRDHWRRAPFLAPQAGHALAGAYGVEDYLADLADAVAPPFRAVTVQDGARVFSQHDTVEDLRAAVAAGAVSATKISRLWHGGGPTPWGWMRALFGDLCRAVAMIYLDPETSEDVDLFLAGPRSGLGAHIDATDVFTLQLAGERHWTVDETVQLPAILDLMRDPAWHPSQEVPFQAPTRSFTLQPGDGLYVPAHAVHRVSGVSWSVSLSFGLRTVNEIDLIEHLLDRAKRSRYRGLPPLPSWPASEADGNAAAKRELVGRVRDLLRQIEFAATATAMAPLRLPATLAEPSADVPDGSPQERRPGVRPPPCGND
ncbi:JmjC domain-containing protein [Methylobacterium aquaticum]|uniref:JmjC domain-containing protein n=1 Tax=Methylobacterium aquaticum TaxID=270351 RepID=UPI003D185C14